MTEFVPSKKLPGVILITPEQHNDWRGDYSMIYNKELYAQQGITDDFVEHCISTSSKGVLRGLHADYGCNKLLSCLHGGIYYVLLDPKSAVWDAFLLTDKNRLQLYKPKQYAAGLLALTDDALFMYYQSAYYDPSRQQSWRFDDIMFNIFWPIKDPPLSERDKKADSSILWK